MTNTTLRGKQDVGKACVKGKRIGGILVAAIMACAGLARGDVDAWAARGLRARIAAADPSTLSDRGFARCEKTAKVTYAGDWAIDTSKGSNLSTLKLAYKAATGALSGSFKVCVLENMKMMATVNGVSVDGVGYGLAVIKNNGSAPVVLLTAEDEP